MQLIIENPDRLDLDSFCNYLCAKLHIYSLDDSLYTPSLTALWNEYFQELYNGSTAIPTVSEVVRTYFDNLVYYKNNDDYVIEIAKLAQMSNINTSVDELARIINYGTLDMPKYPIVDKIYNLISSQLEYYYNRWIEGN